MSDDADLKIKASLEGEVAVAEGLKRVSDGLDKVASKAKTTTAPTAAVNKSFEEMVGKGRQVVGAVGNITGALSSLSPELAKATGIVSRLAGGVAGATAVFGPWGIAIGAVTAGLPLLIDYLSDVVAETDLVTEAFTKSARSLSDYIAQVDRAAAQATAARNVAGTSRESAGRAAAAGGAAQATAQQLREALRSRGISDSMADQILTSDPSRARSLLQTFAAATSRRRSLSGDSTGVSEFAGQFAPGLAELEQQRRAQAAFDAEARRRRENEDAFAYTEPSGTGSVTGGGPHSSPRPRSRTHVPTAEEIANLKIKLEQIAEEERATRLLATAEEDLIAVKLKGIEVERDAAEARREAADAISAKLAGDTSALRAQEAAAEQTAKNLAIVDGAAQGVADSLTGGFIDATSTAFGALIKGGDEASASFAQLADAAIEGIATQAFAEALKETALGFGSLFVNPPAAAAHFTAAGIWGGLAAGGAVASQLSTASQGGGGSGPTSGGAGSFSSGGDRSSSEPVSIVVNINSPTDRAQIGQMTDAALRAAGRRYEARPSR